MNLLKKIKYPLLKGIDFTGLTFLSPVVRLAYGEEPSVQMKKIGQWIIIPIIAILLFVFSWSVVSGNIRTKSGTLPNPVETSQALNAINTFAEREKIKRDAYNLTGEERLKEIETAKARLAEIQPLVASRNEAVAKAKAAHAEVITSKTGPLRAKYDNLKASFKDAQAARKTALEETASTLQPGNKASYQALIASIKADIDATSGEKDELRLLKSDIDDAAAEKSKDVAKALYAQTKIAEEVQFLEKQIDQLTRDNRGEKIIEAQAKIDTETEALTALTGPEAFKKARTIARNEERLEKTISSSYAMPKTFWYQVRRSVLCVFTGFILGSVVAIPIGILCGLNSTFMAAMTPFVAIFKPVSPIVWLPICLIIASFYVPSPEDSGFMKWLWEIPLIGPYEINPAFIASAATVALCSLWATLANTALGVASIDKDHMNVARVLKLGFWSRLFKIVIPSALPLIFAGLRISLGVGWMVLIAAELLASSEGIGKFVWDQFNNGGSDSFAKMVVVVFIVGFIGLLLDRIMVVFQRLVSFEGGAASV